MDRPQNFTKIDLKPKRHHGYAVLLFILGTLLPPLAVAARFGIGSDFWLNCVLTICGYIPGHVHNFYIQNIRNNKNKRRTPKWAIRYGLVDTTEINRKKKRSQWATRYNERLPESTLEGQELEEGQLPDNPSRQQEREQQRNGDVGGDLWSQDDEAYYRSRDNVSVRSGETGSSGRWRYPANFEGTEPAGGKKSKKGKKDRWARVDEAMLGDGPGPGGSSKKKKKSSSKKGRSTDTNDAARRSLDSIAEPEDAVGGLYGERAAANGSGAPKTAEDRDRELRDVFDHQF